MVKQTQNVPASRKKDGSVKEAKICFKNRLSENVVEQTQIVPVLRLRVSEKVVEQIQNARQCSDSVFRIMWLSRLRKCQCHDLRKSAHSVAEQTQNVPVLHQMVENAKVVKIILKIGFRIMYLSRLRISFVCCALQTANMPPFLAQAYVATCVGMKAKWKKLTVYGFVKATNVVG